MDQIINKRIENFLSLQNPTEAQIKDGATMLLQVAPNSSRGIYNSAMLRPKAMLPWIVADLKKHLAIRKRGLSVATVENYNRETVKRIKETLQVQPQDVKVAQSGDSQTIPVLDTRGKRADHDNLPEEIQALWDRNAERWQKMRKYHAQLAQMIAKPDYQPCDGNELCYQLRQMDNALRDDYAKYDAYSPTVAAAAEGKEKADSVDVFTDNVKTIQNARTAISRGLDRKMAHTEDSLAKLQEAVNTLFALKQTVKPKTIEKLKAVGILIPTDNA